MKRILLLALTLFAAKAQAQTIAKDWTQTDCNQVSHNLFSELDSGNVVVLEFVMMDCAPCVTAAKGISPVVEKYKTSHPGKVRFYSMGYVDNYDCEDLNAWKNDNDFTHTVLPGIKNMVDYYGGMGMPTVVVLGNGSRKVFYKKQGYSANENAKIETAINTALSSTGINEALNASLINIYPNPTANVLNITLGDVKADLIQITDAAGRQIFMQDISANNKPVINIENLEAGIYQLNFLNNGQLIGTKSFVKSTN